MSSLDPARLPGPWSASFEVAPSTVAGVAIASLATALLPGPALGCSSLEPIPVVETTTSSGSGAGGSGAAGAMGGAGGQGGAPHGIAALDFGDFELWAEPIDDYLQAGHEHQGDWDFQRGIHDLMVWQDRLYLGYGDANVNLGSAIGPITFRSISSTEEPTVTEEFSTNEEQLDRFRLLGGDLFVAGIDATLDAWLGNVYFRKPTGDWVESRTLDGGVHVHDVFDFDGAHYAVGSGATEQEWGAGEIFTHLWRSTDGGTTFEILDRHDNGGGGDARWIRLLPVGEQLWLFGYSTNAAFTALDDLINGTYANGQFNRVEAEHPWEWALLFETAVMARGTPDEFGIAWGVDFMDEPLHWQMWRVEPSGAISTVEALAGTTVIDVYPHEETGQAVVLLHEGDPYPTPELTEWQVRLLVTEDFVEFTELLALTTELPPRSIAFWRDGLLLGTDEGQIYRSVGTPR